MSLRALGNAARDHLTAVDVLFPIITRETDAQRWLRQNSAAILRAHADMLADQASASSNVIEGGRNGRG